MLSLEVQEQLEIHTIILVKFGTKIHIGKNSLLYSSKEKILVLSYMEIRFMFLQALITRK